jgi:hypothetical protein
MVEVIYTYGHSFSLKWVGGNFSKLFYKNDMCHFSGKKHIYIF